MDRAQVPLGGCACSAWKVTTNTALKKMLLVFSHKASEPRKRSFKFKL